MKIKNRIINILGILFIINVFVHLFLYKYIYKFYINIGNYYADLIERIINVPSLIFIIIFIIVVGDLIFDLWHEKKFRIKKISIIVIIIFVLISTFSAPFKYLEDKTLRDDFRSKTYKLDKLLTIVDFKSNEADFDGGTFFKKYLYIPFSNKLIIIDGFNYTVEKLNNNKYYIVNDYYKES